MAGFGAGHILDMIKRMENNRKLRKRGKFKGSYLENLLIDSEKEKHYLKFKNLSEEELAVLRKKHRELAKLQRKKTQKVLAVFFTITLILIALLIWVLNG